MLVIIQRHGERWLKTGEKSGDGPLTEQGRETAERWAHAIVGALRSLDVKEIDLAVISGSIRCAETFSLTWRVLRKAGIVIRQYDMSKDYFSTPEEDVAWTRLYTEKLDQYLADQDELGEKGAILKHMGGEVSACVDRTISAVSANSKVVLFVTHGPHDALIAQHFTNQGHPGLQMGHAMIILGNQVVKMG